jgi:hypothetical protein
LFGRLAHYISKHQELSKQGRRIFGKRKAPSSLAEAGL